VTIMPMMMLVELTDAVADELVNRALALEVERKAALPGADPLEALANVRCARQA